MVTIKDIANKAGVSISTVSYALNGNSKISKKTTDKILAIAKELDYIPNAAGRHLKKKETRIIGIFIMNYIGAFFGPVFKGTRDALNNHGYELIVCNGKRSHRFIPEGMIDGAIILNEPFSNEDLLHYADRGHKIVVLDRELAHPNINQILLDNKTGAELAINHLIDLGHKKIYIVPGDENIYDARVRLESARALMKRRPDIDYTELQWGVTPDRAAQQIIDDYSQPVAVFCYNDETAIDMYRYFSATDFRIGEHIHIMGFDNIELSSYVNPRLSTIDFSRYEWGFLAANQLIQMLRGETVSRLQIDVSLVKGESVKPIS